MRFGEKPICAHEPTGRVVSDVGAKTAVEAGVCSRTECIESAVEWVQARSRGDAVYEPFNRQIIEGEKQ